MQRVTTLMLVLTSACAVATSGLNHDLGGWVSGRVGAVQAEKNNPYASLYNPALIPAQEHALVSFATSLGSMKFDSLSSVLVDSQKYRTRDGSASRVEDFKPSAVKVSHWSLGVSLPFRLPPWAGPRRGGIGVVLAGPYNTMRRFRSTTPYEFQVLRYGTTDSQLRAIAGAGFEILPKKLFLGASAAFYINVTGTGDAEIVSENPTGRLALDVGFNSTLIAGLYADLDWIRSSFVFRQALNPTMRQELNGRVQVAEGTGSLWFPSIIQASLYYEPQSLEWEVQHGTRTKVSLGVSYEFWKSYRPSFTVLETTTRDGETLSTQSPRMPFKNTWNPRISIETPTGLDRLSICGGYKFRPSPVSGEAMEGLANVLDSDIHQFGTSLKYSIEENEVLNFPLSMAVFLQYHVLKSRSVRKNAPDSIGSPGYKFKGNGFFYGLSLEAVL